MTLTGANAGLFSKGTITVEDIRPGTFVDVTIRAWDRDFGATYELTSTQWKAESTFSIVLRPISPIDEDFPISLWYAGFKGLNITGVPEPTVAGLLGFGCVLWAFWSTGSRVRKGAFFSHAASGERIV